MTDTEMLDFLESENKKSQYTGKCVFRVSMQGRGWRLHETSRIEASETVREAIQKAMLIKVACCMRTESECDCNNSYGD